MSCTVKQSSGGVRFREVSRGRFRVGVSQKQRGEVSIQSGSELSGEEVGNSERRAVIQSGSELYSKQSSGEVRFREVSRGRFRVEVSQKQKSGGEVSL